jgi:hypothetical protein
MARLIATWVGMNPSPQPALAIAFALAFLACHPRRTPAVAVYSKSQPTKNQQL